MSKTFVDVREYQNQARTAGFYHTTNLVLCYLCVQIFAEGYFDRSSDCEGVQAEAVCIGEGRSLLLSSLSEWTRHERGDL